MERYEQLECADFCAVEGCRQKCAPDVVDELLSTPGAVNGEEVDLLLDFRSLVRAECDAESALRVFCELRRRLEHRHYLSFYRVRRWLERHTRAEIIQTKSDRKIIVPVQLNFYCIEAVRRRCICEALMRSETQSALRLHFTFNPSAQLPIQSLLTQALPVESR